MALQNRGDTAANWTSVNPTPLARQICIETDTKKLKIGDGTTAWNSLAYYSAVASVSFTGMAKGNGSAIVLATAGTDYLAPGGVAGSITSQGALATLSTAPVANGGTGLTAAPANGQLLIGNGSGFTLATLTAGSNITIANSAGSITISASGSGGSATAAGSDTQIQFNNATAFGASSALTWNNSTAILTVAGTTKMVGTATQFAARMVNAVEPANVVGTAPGATTNFYLNIGAVQYYTANNANNFTLNIAFSSTTSLNTAMSVGDVVSFNLRVVNGATAYYPNAFTIDGAAVTPKWAQGTAVTAGSASAVDQYFIEIVKTASATYDMYVTQTKFA